jgi:hypothetical protein
MQSDKSDSGQIESVQPVNLSNPFEDASGIAPAKTELAITRAYELLVALQEKMQHAADKAVEKAIATHLDVAVQGALERVDKGLRKNDLQVAWTDEPQSRTEEELDSYRSRAEEIAQQLELLIKTAQGNFSEMKKFVDYVTHKLEPQLHARLSESFGRAAKELENGAAQVSERQFANFTMGTQAAWQEALLQLDARIAAARPLFENAVNIPSPERMETLLHSIKQETLGSVETRFEEMRSHSEEQQELQRTRLEEVAQKLEKLAGSPVFENAPNIPSPERMETLLQSITQETLGSVDRRLEEMRSHREEQQELQRARLEEVAQKLEKLAGSPVSSLDEARKLAVQVARGLEPQIYARLEESVDRAAQNFESTATRASDRQLVRLMDEKQRIAREASLEIEASAAYARSNLQKAANATLDEFRRQVEVQIDLAISEATQRMTSRLASLDAEHRVACDVRRHALENDVACAAEQSTQEFRTAMKAFLHSCLVAAVSAVDEHAQTTRNGLGKNAVGLPKELVQSFEPSGKGLSGSSNDDYSH